MSGEGSGATLDLRWWRERDHGLWVVASVSAAAVVAGIGLVVAGRSSDDAGLVLPGALVLAVGTLDLILLFRRRVVVDADGITARLLRTHRWPWTSEPDVLVGVADRGPSSVVVIDRDRRGTKLCVPTDVPATIAAIEALRPPPAGAGTDDRPTGRGDGVVGASASNGGGGGGASEAPLPVVVVGSSWSLGGVFGAIGGVFALGLFWLVDELASPDRSWTVAVALGMFLVAMVVAAVAVARSTRRFVAADRAALTVGRVSDRRTHPWGSIDHLVLVRDPLQDPTGQIGAVIAGEVVAIPTPVINERRRALLLERLVALHGSASAADGVDDRDGRFDPSFEPPAIPSAPVRWLVPVALWAFSAATAIVICVGLVAEHRAADLVEARAVETTARLVAADTRNRNTAVVAYDTSGGLVTAEIDVTAEERDGTAPILVWYDQLDPSTVWPADAHLTVVSSWVALGALACWIATGVGAGLWTRWHPPDWQRRAAIEATTA